MIRDYNLLSPDDVAARRLPSPVHSAISTPAEASRTIAGVVSSGLVEVPSLGQMFGNTLAKVTRHGPANGLYPRSGIEVRAGRGRLGGKVHSLRRVIKVDRRHTEQPSRRVYFGREERCSGY